ncbi:hypothetical protein [Nocardia fluminea]|uniref:hypothetical protein n=1 Tax=Nocardia fluminea TaxID=134984 RepID=UPI003D114C9E
MSSRHSFYPLPRELHAEMGFRECLGFAMTLGLGAFLLFQAVTAAAAHDWLHAAFYLSSGLCFSGFLLLIRASLVGRRRITIEGTTLLPAEGHLIVPWSRKYFCAIALAMGSLIPAGSIMSIGIWSDRLNIPLTPGQAGVFSILGLPLSLFAAAFIATHISMQRTRSLTLSPKDLILPGMIKFHRTIRWADVKGIEMGSSTLGSAEIHVQVRRSGGQNDVKRRIYAERFSIGAAATLQLLRFYHANPQLRGELADHRAVERVLSYGLLDQGPSIDDSEAISW